MASPLAVNWEEELLTEGLSERARRAGAVYTGPGAGGVTQQRTQIELTGGVPDPVCLPIDDLIVASESVLRRDGHDALQYGGAQGFKGLRDWLADHWTKIEGMPLTAENFSLTGGSAHALANVCETLLDAGDTVIAEGPSFPGSLRTIRSLGATIEQATLDADGLDVDALEGQLADLDRRGVRPKLLYTIPTYHNPTGATMRLDRRHRLIELCQRYGVVILEDDAYGEIGFEGAPPPSLYALARGRGVIKIGTFSKILATGLRVGWVQASRPVIDALVAMRFDMGTSPLVLRTIARYAEDGRLDDHIRDLCEFYGRKRDLMENELRERCASFLTWSSPAGGFFLWLKLNPNVDTERLVAASQKEGVAFVMGRRFFAQPRDDDPNYIRLAYSNVSEDKIPEGIRRLGRALEAAARPE
jgi:2-aminoadipate transaminase